MWLLISDEIVSAITEAYRFAQFDMICAYGGQMGLRCNANKNG